MAKWAQGEGSTTEVRLVSFGPDNSIFLLIFGQTWTAFLAPKFQGAIHFSKAYVVLINSTIRASSPDKEYPMLLFRLDYERIYRVINSVIIGEKANPSTAALFFGVYGSQILSEYYNIDASPKVGLAAYRLDGNNDILLFAEKRDGTFTSDGEAFHCWIEADGWVIDFMAPAFSQINQSHWAIPAKMFQKPLSKMASSVEDLKMPGDFFLQSAPDITNKHMRTLHSKPIYSDLAEICKMWFTKPPREINRSIGISDEKGIMKTVYLTGEELVGKW